MSKGQQSGGGIGGVGGGGGEPPEDGPDVSPESIAAERLEEAASGSEDRVDELLAEVASLRRELSEAREAAERAGRRAEIERALSEAGAIDLEIATPMIEEAVAAMEEPDVAGAVAELKAAKGFLFRSIATAGAGASSGASPRGSALAAEGRSSTGLDDLAGDARASGDRSDLLRYLRARRG